MVNDDRNSRRAEAVGLTPGSGAAYRVVSLLCAGCESIRWWARASAAGTFSIRVAPAESAPDLLAEVASQAATTNTAYTGQFFGPAAVVEILFTPTVAAAVQVSGQLYARGVL